MKKTVFIIFILLMIVQFGYSQYDSYDRGGAAIWEDDEEKMTLTEVGSSLLMGGVLAVVGFLIMQIKATNTFGRILVGIGAFLGGGAVVIYLLQVIGMILSAAFSLAYKLAIVVGVILLAGWIIKGVYDWITGNNK